MFLQAELLHWIKELLARVFNDSVSWWDELELVETENTQPVPPSHWFSSIVLLLRVWEKLNGNKPLNGYNK